MKSADKIKRGRLELPMETNILTQGILSITDGRGEVILKVSSCCYGNKLDKLAKKIKTNRATTAERVYALAVECGVGNKDCLVVMDEKNVVWKGYGRLSPAHRKKFSSPRYNPRWGFDSREYVVTLSTKDFM